MIRLLSLFALPFLLLAPLAQAFDIRGEIDQLQERYGHVMPYPILMVDQDELNWRYLQAGAIEKQNAEHEKTRQEILGEYVQERVGLELTPQQLAGLETYTWIMREGAFAFPIVEGSYRDSRYTLCAVFTPSANSNKRLEHERLLGLTETQIYGERTYNHLTRTLPYETLALYSLYHELSHCLDSHFMPRMYQNGEDAHTIHLAESFAESLALLLLHQKGIQNIAQTRGMHRMVSSRFMGRFFAQNPHNGFGHPGYEFGGIIYHLDPALRKASEFILSHRNTIQTMSTMELVEHTRTIVDSSALSSRSFYPIVSFLRSDKPEEVIQEALKKAYDWPEMFYRPYRELLEFSHYSDFIITQAFSETPVSNPDQSLELMPIQLGQLCEALERDDQEQYQGFLQELRNDLRANNEAAPEKLRARARELNQIETTLLSTCSPLH